MSSSRRRTASVDVVDAKVAVDLATAQPENVFLFVPNLIGYTRVILAAVSLHFMSYHPKYCTITYAVSCLLDAFDGYAARALKQESKFGAVLDMVTDRCTTSCLLVYLSSAYPAYALVFQFLITLDFSSHYMYMYSTLATGSRSHKSVTSDVSRILSFYYSPKILFSFCFGNELFFVALYLIQWDQEWAKTLALGAAPFCLVKNFFNMIQLWKAAKILVGIDLVERAIAQEAVEARKRRLN